VQDIGPIRQGSALAFKGVSVALFGGSGSAAGNPATVLGDTWDWNGQHWTQRQDMGPAPRWLHGMAFDSARGRLVLFGGTVTSAGDTQLGDTWEAPGDSGPAPPGGITLASLDILPLNAAFSALNGFLTLTGPAPPGGVVVIVDGDMPVGNLQLGAISLGGGPPWNVPISAGTTNVAFIITVSSRGLGKMTFRATFGSTTKTASITLP
jgi:hypothetical protein